MMNYFDLLGLDSDATAGQIRQAYRRLAVKYHPDRCKDRDARKQFERITAAYKILRDPVKRSSYMEKESTGVTDNPWDMLEDYWSSIACRGFDR